MSAFQKLLDYHVPPEAGFVLESLVATTYLVDFEFFEEDLLPKALGVQAPSSRTRVFRTEIERCLRNTSVSVLYDMRGCPGVVRTSPRIDPLPVKSRKLHAKVTLLMWVKGGSADGKSPVRHVRLIVGSANLTRPGFRENYECAVALDFGLKGSAGRAVLISAINFVERIGAECRSRTLSQQLSDFRAFALGVPVGGFKQDKPIAFVSAEDMLQGLQDAWAKMDGSRPSSVTVVSPFWPEGPTAAQALKSFVDRLLRPRRLDFVCRGTLAPNGTDWIPEFDPQLAVQLRAQIDSQLFLSPALQGVGVDEARDDKGDETEAEEIGRSMQANGSGLTDARRALHAKMIFVDGDKGSLVYVGSSNCTRRGMALGGQSNWEAGLVYRLSRSWRNRVQRLLDMAGKAVEVLPGKPPVSKKPDRDPDIPVPTFLSEIVATRTRVSIRFERGISVPKDLLILMPVPGKLGDAGSWVLHQARKGKVAGAQLVAKLADCARCDARLAPMPKLPADESLGPNVYVTVHWEGKDGTFPVRFDDKASLPLLIAGRRPTESELIEYFLFGREPDPDDDGAGGGGGRKAPPPDKDAPIDTGRILAYFIRRFVQAIPGIETEIVRSAYSRVALESALRGPTSPLELAERALASLSRPPEGEEPIKTPTAVGFQLVEIICVLERCRNRIVEKELKACVDPVIKRCREILDNLVTQNPPFRSGAFYEYRTQFAEKTS